MAGFADWARFQVIPAMVCVAAGGAALMCAGCDEKVDANVAKIKLNGKTFLLEIAADADKRFLGLGKRDSIEPDGGMLFVFPAQHVQVQNFVMRDCKFPIDIIFLDSAGRVLAMHTMKVEPERGPDEQPDALGFNDKYDNRLPKYSSRYPSQFVIELKGGTLQSLNLKEGDLVKYDWEALKKIAR